MSETVISALPALPRMRRIRQHFPRPLVEDVVASMAAEMRTLLTAASVKAGQKVGLTVGSRGIQNIVTMLKTAVDCVREVGAEPVLLSAMGSHGGGTEEGQLEVLASFGITEERIGAPIVTCTHCREIGTTATGLMAYMLDSAFEVDVIIPINRVKTHTSFKGDVESGLFKKLVVGLGGPGGAQQFHSQGKASELAPLLRHVGDVILQKMPVIGGIVIIENAYEETALIKAVAAQSLFEEEKALLLYSKSLMPALPAQNLDALIVERMGKNFSGTGMDTNIIGRLRIQGEPEPVAPSIRYIAVWDLTDDTHGNACGIGLADFTTQKLVDKIDKKPTYLNCLTTTFPVRASIPLHLPTERDVLHAMLTCLQGSAPADKVRLISIPNTLYLSECYVSEGLVSELEGCEHIEFLGDYEDITFTAEGDMRPFLS